MAAISGSPPAWPMSSPPESPEPAAYHISPVNELSPHHRETSKITSSAPSSFEIQSKEMSFTPQRARAPPRAWERRPATPYVPRNEGQKIWKRVPLGELGVEVMISSKEEKERADYIRTIKRLKVKQDANSSDTEEDEVEGNSDKENACIVPANIVNGVQQRPKNGVKPLFSFVGTKTDENIIEAGTSPRKKLRPMPEDPDHSDMMISLKLEAEPVSTHLSTQAGGAENDAKSDACSSIEHEEIDTATNQELIEQVPNMSEEVIPFEKDLASTAEPVSGVEEAAIYFKQYRTAVNSAGDKWVASTFSGRAPWVQEGTKPAEESRKMRERSSPAQLSEIAKVPEEETSQEQCQKAVSKPAADDDTAFLHDFLSRAKAQRAAREVEAQNASQQQPVVSVDGESESQSILEKFNDEERPADSALPESEADPNLDAIPSEGDVSSPVRRSSRSATVKSTAQAARIKSLPNAIQLKRANGSEFIFTANKAQGAANVAILTRSNTKMNKGTASNVGERLRQLHAYQDEFSQPGLDGSSVSGSAAGDTTSNKMNISKKRKREKAESGSRVKKALRWNEEELTRYREASPVKWAEDDSADSTEAKSQVEEQEEATKRLAISIAGQETSVEEAQSGKAEEASKAKVRRVRRGVAGSVNGTPAPKKRTKDMFENDDDEPTPREITTEDAAVANIDNKAIPAEKKSRMPVPISTPAKFTAPSKISRLADASGLPTTASSSSSNDKPVVPSTEQKSERLERRKLRVRG